MLENKIKKRYKKLETIFTTDQCILFLSFDETFENTCIIKIFSFNLKYQLIIRLSNLKMNIDFNINNYDTIQKFITDIVKTIKKTKNLLVFFRLYDIILQSEEKMLEDSKTKLICTIGPSTYNYEVFKELVKEGMNVARVNGSHATDEEIATVVSNVTNVNKELNTNVALLFDIAGPKIRTGTFVNGEVMLTKGNYVSIVRENIVGDETKFTINNKSLIDNLKVGDTVYLNDGLLTLKVVEVSSDEVKCFIANDCKIKDRRGVNVPGLFYDVDFLEDKDRIMIKKALENNTTFLALSFVQTKDNILEVKEYVRSLGYNVPKIIAKIESYSALTHIDEILDEVDGIMIARGDLALEVDVEQVPIIQKKFVKKAKMKNKLAIVATEMMGSMIDSPRPTRAELTDVCNAVFDMTDAVMLSGETTIGQYPVETVRYMKTLCKTSEANPELIDRKSVV